MISENIRLIARWVLSANVLLTAAKFVTHVGTQPGNVRFVPKADIVTRLVTVTQMLTNDLHHPIG